MVRKVINKKWIPVIQAIGVPILIAILFGIYDKLSVLTIIQERQDRQGISVNELRQTVEEHDKSITSLEVSVKYYEEEINRLQENERRNRSGN